MSRRSTLQSAALFTLSGIALLLAGCAPSIVGKWSGNMTGVGGNGTLEFKKDGTFEQNMTVENPLVKAQIQATGTYKAESDKLDLKVGDVMANGKSVKSLIPAPAMSKMNQSGTYKVDGDKLTLTVGGGSTTLERVKQP